MKHKIIPAKRFERFLMPRNWSEIVNSKTAELFHGKSTFHPRNRAFFVMNHWFPFIRPAIKALYFWECYLRSGVGWLAMLVCPPFPSKSDQLPPGSFIPLGLGGPTLSTLMACLKLRGHGRQLQVCPWNKFDNSIPIMKRFTHFWANYSDLTQPGPPKGS